MDFLLEMVGVVVVMWGRGGVLSLPDWVHWFLSETLSAEALGGVTQRSLNQASNEPVPTL